MITLHKRKVFYAAYGRDAALMGAIGYHTLVLAKEGLTALIPIDSLSFHLWAILTVDDVCVGETCYVVTGSRSAYQRRFEALMRQARTKGGAWTRAVAEFKSDFVAMVSVSEDVAEQLPMF